MAVYTQIIYALVLQRIFFHTTPAPLSFVGTAIIMMSAIYVALTKESTKSAATDEQVRLEDVGDDMMEEGLLDDSEESDLAEEGQDAEPAEDNKPPR